MGCSKANQKRFGIDYSLNLMRALLADWEELTPQKQVVRSLAGNDDAIRKWVGVEYPKIKNTGKKDTSR